VKPARGVWLPLTARDLAALIIAVVYLAMRAVHLLVAS
jgi:hypothetical protein